MVDLAKKSTKSIFALSEKNRNFARRHPPIAFGSLQETASTIVGPDGMHRQEPATKILFPTGKRLSVPNDLPTSKTLRSIK